jgi:hypothetical protein
MKSLRSKRIFHCEKCFKNFDSKSELKNHLAEIHAY